LVLSFTVFGQVAENPAQEFLDGKITKFSTKNHSKSKGLSFEISVPKSWTSREGKRPNIIQFFKSADTESGAAMSLMVKDIPVPKGYVPTKKEIQELFAPNQLRTFVDDGATFIEGKAIMLEGQRGAMVISEQTIERLDLKLKLRMLGYTLFYKNKLIYIGFTVSGTEDKGKQIVENFNKMKPLFLLIANSLVLTDKYK